MTVTRTGMTCDYCGKSQETDDKVQDWTMHERTGKTSCPDCHERGNKEARAIIDKLISLMVRSVK